MQIFFLLTGGAFWIEFRYSKLQPTTGSNDQVTLGGKVTHSEGNVLFRNATISTQDHAYQKYVMYNQVIANYTSVPGDSGGPIIVFENNIAKLVGMHTGTVCEFESLSEGQPEIKLDNTLCPKTENYYKGFTSWDMIKNELQIR